MKDIITPRKLPGFMELQPNEQIKFNFMLDKIRSVFEKHCFLPLDTPVLELSEILLAKSGGDIDKEIYRFSKGSTDMCMRYDFTVPLARFVAMNFQNLNFPFKRYQIGKVFRGERPQKGRFREFYQCDADIIGHQELPLVADAECINLCLECFDAIKLDTVVEISDRRILNGVLEDLNLKEKSREILTIIDKLDKVGKDGIFELLKEIGISENDAKKLIEITQLKGPFKEVLSTLEKLSSNQTFMEGVESLKQLDNFLSVMRQEKNYILNMSIIRGHDYYTGTVFEVFLKDNLKIGAVGAGGRFENLASYFSNEKLPGVGMSIGLTRLFDQLSSLNLLQDYPVPINKILILPLGETLLECLKISNKLQKAGICCDVLYDNKSFKNKLKEANRRKAEFVLIVGEDEVKNSKYSLKNMTSGDQESLTIEEIIKKLS